MFFSMTPLGPGILDLLLFIIHYHGTNYKYWEKHVQTLLVYLAQVVGTSQSHKTVLCAV